MVRTTLTDHPEVVYGAALALLIVVLLTPAVGGMARMLGVVDRPGARRVNRSPVPRLGGLALFFGIFVPALAFLPLGHETKGLLLGMAVATMVGAIRSEPQPRPAARRARALLRDLRAGARLPAAGPRDERAAPRHGRRDHGRRDRRL